MPSLVTAFPRAGRIVYINPTHPLLPFDHTYPPCVIIRFRVFQEPAQYNTPQPPLSSTSLSPHHSAHITHYTSHMIVNNNNSDLWHATIPLPPVVSHQYQPPRCLMYLIMLLLSIVIDKLLSDENLEELIPLHVYVFSFIIL